MEEENSKIGEILSNHFDGLNKPVTVSLGLYVQGDYRYMDREVIVSFLRKEGIDAVLENSPEGADVTKFVVGESGISFPLLSSNEARKAAQDVVKILDKYNVEIMGYALPLSEGNMVRFSSESGGVNEILKKEKSFVANMLKEGKQLPIAKFESKTSLYRGGTLGNQPYAVVSPFCRARDVAFATDDVEIAKCFSGADRRSWGGRIHYDEVDGAAYGFIYEVEKAPDQKFYDAYGIEFRQTTGHLETPIFEHRNKLKGIYLNDEGRCVQIAGEGGKFINKDWERFAILHSPVVTTDNQQKIVRNNKLLQMANEGKTVSYTRSAKSLPMNFSDNQRQTANIVEKTIKKGEKSVARLEEKLAAKGGAEVAKQVIAETAKKKTGLLAKAAAANAKFDKAVDKVIEKGAKKLNNSKVGKAYDKAASKIGNTKAGKAVGAAAKTVAKKAAETAAGKAVGKVVAKTVGTAVGKSVLKKIPLVSAVAGSYFAYERIKNGEWKAAGCEFLSGVAGCFPGVGTAVSVGLDTGLVANDIHQVVKSAKASKPVKAPVAAPKKKFTAQAKQTNTAKKTVQKTKVSSQQMLALKQNGRA